MTKLLRVSLTAVLCALGAIFFAPAQLTAAPQPLPSPVAAPLPPALEVATPLSFAGLSLAQAQDDAVQQSPEVAIARAKLDGASAALNRARAAFGPSIVAGYTRNPQSGSSPQPAVVVQHSFNVGLQTTLGNVAAFVPGLNQAEAVYRAARFSEQAAQRVERTKVASSYFSALQARATALVRDQALQLAEAQLRGAQKRFAAGVAPRIDVVRAEVGVARATGDKETAHAADANATEALAIETGVSAVALQQTATGSVPAISPGLRNPATAVEIALTQRGDIQAARNDVSAASAALRSARVGLLPVVIVSAGYAHGVDVGQPISGPTLNATFELPLNASASSQIATTNAALVEARARLRLAQRQVTLEVGAAVRNLNAAILATAAASKARIAAQEEFNAIVIGYRTGASSSLERDLAGATYADARLAELTAIYNEASARAILALEIGS